MGGFAEGERYVFYPPTILPEAVPESRSPADNTIDVEDIIGACASSDVYNYASLIEAQLPKDYQTVEVAPDKIVLALMTALEAHDATRKIPNSPHLLEIIREHDKKSYVEHAKKADLLVHILRELVGEDGTISRQDFSDWAGLYNLMPDTTEEQERFTRIFATRNGVYFDETGYLHVRPLSFKQSLRIAGRVSTAELLDKVQGMPYDAPPIPAPPKLPQPAPKQKPQTSAANNNKVEPKPYVSPIEYLRNADGKLPVPAPPRHQRLPKLEEIPASYFESRATAFKQELRARLEAFYERLPDACIITDYDIRRRALKGTSFFGHQDAKAVVRELVAEDERFNAWDINRKIFTIVKLGAPDDAYAKLERIIKDQQLLTVRALNKIEKQMGKIRSWERNIVTSELQAWAQSLDPEANISLVHYLARLDPRISSSGQSKLHLTVPMDKRKLGQQSSAERRLNRAILTPDMADTQTAPKESEPEDVEKVSLVRRLSRLALQACKLPWRRA